MKKDSLWKNILNLISSRLCWLDTIYVVSTSLCRVDGVKGGSGLAQHVNKYLVKGADSLYLYFIFNTPFGTNLEYDEKQIYFHNVGNFAFANIININWSCAEFEKENDLLDNLEI